MVVVIAWMQKTWVYTACEKLSNSNGNEIGPFIVLF
jgi:hypothetical protein